MCLVNDDNDLISITEVYEGNIHEGTHGEGTCKEDIEEKQEGENRMENRGLYTWTEPVTSSIPPHTPHPYGEQLCP